MIDSFLSSWPLFHDVYIAGALIAVLLSLVGIAVIVRDQVFLGAAVSQASLLGIALGIWLDTYAAGSSSLAWMATDTTHSLMGGVFAVAGSLAVAAAAPRLRESREALTGWVFLVGASLSVLVVSNSPHGMTEVNRLLSSTVIGANHADVTIVTVLLVVTVVVLALRLRPLLLLLVDAEMAAACGVAVARWERLLAVWLGLAVAWSMHVTGLVYTFGCLVLPALIAKNLVRELHTMVVVAPVVAAVGVLAAFVLAHHFDLPPGQVAVAILALLQAAAWTWKTAVGR
ncbi:MAG: metal ABC transporter permease [Candidatus Binatia bacterium]